MSGKQQKKNEDDDDDDDNNNFNSAPSTRNPTRASSLEMNINYLEQNKNDIKDPVKYATAIRNVMRYFRPSELLNDYRSGQQRVAIDNLSRDELRRYIRILETQMAIEERTLQLQAARDQARMDSERAARNEYHAEEILDAHQQARDILRAEERYIATYVDPPARRRAAPRSQLRRAQEEAAAAQKLERAPLAARADSPEPVDPQDSSGSNRLTSAEQSYENQQLEKVRLYNEQQAERRRRTEAELEKLFNEREEKSRLKKQQKAEEEAREAEIQRRNEQDRIRMDQREAEEKRLAAEERKGETILRNKQKQIMKEQQKKAKKEAKLIFKEAKKESNRLADVERANQIRRAREEYIRNHPPPQEQQQQLSIPNPINISPIQLPSVQAAPQRNAPLPQQSTPRFFDSNRALDQIQFNNTNDDTNESNQNQLVLEEDSDGSTEQRNQNDDDEFIPPRTEIDDLLADQAQLEEDTDEIIYDEEGNEYVYGDEADNIKHYTDLIHLQEQKNQQMEKLQRDRDRQINMDAEIAANLAAEETSPSRESTYDVMSIMQNNNNNNQQQHRGAVASPSPQVEKQESPINMDLMAPIVRRESRAPPPPPPMFYEPEFYYLMGREGESRREFVSRFFNYGNQEVAERNMSPEEIQLGRLYANYHRAGEMAGAFYQRMINEGKYKPPPPPTPIQRQRPNNNMMDGMMDNFGYPLAQQQQPLPQQQRAPRNEWNSFSPPSSPARSVRSPKSNKQQQQRVEKRGENFYYKRSTDEPRGPIRNGLGGRLGRLYTQKSWIFTFRLTDHSHHENSIYFDDDMRLITNPPRSRLPNSYIIPSIDDINAHIPSIRFDPPMNVKLDFISYQLEFGMHGTLNNNFHYQGYLEFSERVSALQIVEIMKWTNQNSSDIWLAPRKSNQKEAIDYTQKEATCVRVIPGNLAERNEEGMIMNWDELPFIPTLRIVEGAKHNEGAANAAAAIRFMVQSGASYDDIAQEYPGEALRNHSGINTQIAAFRKSQPQKMRKVKTFVRWGETGTGKTTGVYAKHGLDRVYKKPLKEHWWDGYDARQHNILLIDEFANDNTTMKIEDFLQWLDNTPLWLPQRYAGTWASFDTVYITSNLPPSRWFPRCSPMHRRALYRRLRTGGITKLYPDTAECRRRHENEKMNSMTDPTDSPYDHENIVFVKPFEEGDEDPLADYYGEEEE